MQTVECATIVRIKFSLKKVWYFTLLFFDIDLEKTNLAIFEDFSEIFYGLKLKAGLSEGKIASYAMSRTLSNVLFSMHCVLKQNNRELS